MTRRRELSDEQRPVTYIVSARPSRPGSSDLVAAVIGARNAESDDFAALGTLISWQPAAGDRYSPTSLLIVTLSASDRDKILSEYVKADTSAETLDRATRVEPLSVVAFDGPVIVLPLVMLKELRGQEARAETARHGAWAFGQSKIKHKANR